MTLRNHSVRFGNALTTPSIGFSTLTANISEAKLLGFGLNRVSMSLRITQRFIFVPLLTMGKKMSRNRLVIPRTCEAAIAPTGILKLNEKPGS
jgi:hypothetical protein